MSSVSKSPDTIQMPEMLGVPFFAFVILDDEPALFNLYNKLIGWEQLGYLADISNKELAELLGKTPEHLSTQIKKLEKLQLVRKTKLSKGFCYKLTIPDSFASAEQLRNILTIKKNLNVVQARDEIKHLSKELKKEVVDNYFEPLTLTNICSNNTKYVSNTNITNDTNLKEEIPIKQELTPQKKKKQSREVQRFPKILYNQVLNAYIKYSGVPRKGNELSWAYKATRNMFLAGRKPKEIIEFMKWISEHCDESEFKWLKHWTMETVRKKLPDYLAGRLQGEEEIDDGFRSLN